MARRMNQRLQGFKAATFPLLAIGLVGCTVVNPHQVAGGLLVTERRPVDAERYAGSLPSAIDAAREQQRIWAGAIAEQSQFRNGLSLAMLPAAAVATFLGITSTGRASRDAIAALAIGGAMGLGAGQLFYSQPRQRVWAQGILAMECAVRAVSPFLMTISEYDGVKSALERIGNDRAVVSGGLTTAKSALTELRQINPTHPKIAAAEVDISIAEALIARADTTATAGQALVGTVNDAGYALREAAMTIVNRVTIEITKTEPSLEVVAATVSGLGALSRRISPVPFAGAGTKSIEVGGQQFAILDAAQAQALAKLVRALDELKASTTALAANTNIVAGIVSRVGAAAKSAGELTDCAYKAPESDFRVEPDVSEIVLAPEQAKIFRVSGGTGTPRPSVVGDAHMKVAVEANIDANGAIVVTVSAAKDAKPGQGNLVITDGAETNRKTIAVRVAAPEAPAAATAAGQPRLPSTTLTLFEQTLQAQNPERVKFIQCMAKVPQDGVIGSMTRAGVKTWRGINAPADAAKDDLDQALFEQMKARAEADPNAADNRACLAILANEPATTGRAVTPSPNDVEDVQDKLVTLGHLASGFNRGEIDNPTCEAIRAFKIATAIDPADCDLNEITFGRIMQTP